MTALYELRGVRQVYGDRPVLTVDALDIHAGEILAIVGPSGAGKSTLLRLLNFLEAPVAGAIRFDGRRGDELDLVQRRRITTLFQRPRLLRRSVRANLAFGLAVQGRRPAPGQVDEWLARLQLAPLAEQAATRLSGGEAQRVALGRALLLAPDVLLLDEPTSNLDPYNVGLMETFIRAANETQAMTIIIVTHNLFQARRLAQRTVLLLAGRLVEVAPTEQFFNAPAAPETAAFVRGDMVY